MSEIVSVTAETSNTEEVGDEEGTSPHTLNGVAGHGVSSEDAVVVNGVPAAIKSLVF